MRSLNRCTLIGHLGRDAETTFTPGGAAVTKFSIATTRKWKDGKSGEWHEETDWANIVAWRIENLANFLLKGKAVYVEGRLQSRSYENKNGEKRSVTEVVAENIILLGSNDSGAGSASRAANPASDEDTPF